MRALTLTAAALSGLLVAAAILFMVRSDPLGGEPFALLQIDSATRPDGTERLAADLGAKVLHRIGGRGPQLAAGAEAARGDWLLFLHADTVLAEGWGEAVRAFIAGPGNDAKVAVFRLALDDPDPRARRIESWARWRARTLALPYGDQGLVIHRALYRALGGIPPIPLMEDVKFVRRIGRQRLVHLEAEARTSAQRYRQGGWWGRPAWNLTLLALYFLGAPPTWLKRLYG